MFTCQLCEGVSKPRQRPKRVVVERRPKTYLNPGGPVSHGWEIVRELAVCAACALSLNKEKEVTEAYGRR
jgi:hypothetical protein